MPTTPPLTCFIVTWEVSLLAVGPLQEALKAFSPWYCPIHANAWAIVTDKDAKAIVERLVPIIGPQGRLFVIRSGTIAAWSNLYGAQWEQWLKINL